MHIQEVTLPAEKSRICHDILRSLPGWFGVEESLLDYVEKVKTLPFYACFADESADSKAAGFLAIMDHNAYTAEIYVMGIRPEYHRHGMGRMLVKKCEEYCRSASKTFLTVKTLDESRADAGYEKTRRFYFAMGFRPIEVFPLLWGEDNPCLFMAKHLH